MTAADTLAWVHQHASYLPRTQCSGLFSPDNHRSINTPWMLRRPPPGRYLRALQQIHYTARYVTQICITFRPLPPQSQCERPSRLAADTAPHVTPSPGVRGKRLPGVHQTVRPAPTHTPDVMRAFLPRQTHPRCCTCTHPSSADAEEQHADGALPFRTRTRLLRPGCQAARPGDARMLRTMTLGGREEHSEGYHSIGARICARVCCTYSPRAARMIPCAR